MGNTCRRCSGKCHFSGSRAVELTVAPILSFQRVVCGRECDRSGDWDTAMARRLKVTMRMTLTSVMRLMMLLVYSCRAAQVAALTLGKS